MALNKYMHSRNIYKTPPDFVELAKLYEEFSAITKTDVSGKVTINFKDPNSLRILTKCLLKHDFNLNVDIPDNRLVPTLPLRLNYILWVEDLLAAIKRESDIQGLDIGTGACAIYPLLAALKNKWNMTGTESDAESLTKALENVQKNNLQELITLKRNTTSSIIEYLFDDENKLRFDFCMCNPPFYSSIQELYESRSPARLPPKNGFTGSPQELITEGGELEFCRKLIKESEQYQDNILIFTTMLGHKYNLNVLSQELKCAGVRHTHTEFCQGRVTRWGLAWTHKDYDIYNLVPPRDKPRKKNTPAIYLLPESPNVLYNVEASYNKIKEILMNLSIEYKILTKTGNYILLNITAKENTWTNQRRKRRMQKRVETQAKKIKSNNEDADPADSSQTTFDISEEDKEPTCKDNSADLTYNAEPEVTNTVKSTDSTNQDNIVIHAFLKLLKKERNIFLEMEFLEGSAGKEGMYQILQYIKNNWKYIFRII